MSFTSILVLLLFISSTNQQNNELDQSFNNLEDVSNSQCEPIEGAISSCHNCYLCDHPTIAKYTNDRKSIVRLGLKKSNSSCTDRTRVCCVNIDDLDQRRLDTDNCGRRVETRGRRSGPKSIVESEIPWHVHIYSANRRKLCAGTYISTAKRSILVPASCVRGKNAQDLRVSFRIPSNADLRNLVEVTSVIVHKDYPGSTSSDIAIVRVSLQINIPHWVQPVCLTHRAPFTPLACISITDTDYYVNSVIPQYCSSVTSPGQLCSNGIPGDYLPEFGAGLICEKLDGEELIYELHGIHLPSAKENSIGTYTNVSHFYNWIDKQ